MHKLCPTSSKGPFLIIAWLILVAVATINNVQPAAAQTSCTFNLVSTGGGQLSSGVTTGDDLEISGNPNIDGSCGSVHVNDDLKISGDAVVEHDVTYSGSLIENKANCGGLCGVRVNPVSVPVIDPNEYADYVEYQLRSNGRVYQSDGSGGWTQIANANSNKWNGWDYSSPKWTMSENSTIDGSFFVEGDLVSSGNPGSAADPWELTIIATGFIEISGNPVVVTNPNNPSQIENLLFVAGTDLKINGNPDQDFEGIMAAHEQLDVSGNPNLNGCIIAESAANNSGQVSENKIGGNMNLTCNTCALPHEDQVIDITEPF